MTLGDIKVEALKLMFVAYSKDFGVDALDELAEDENYGSYISNMPGAINRCFANIENKSILPEKVAEMRMCTYDPVLRTTSFDLYNVPDLFEVCRIISVCEQGRYNENRDFSLEGNIVVIHGTNAADSFKIVYRPKIDRVNSMTADDTVVDVPENIAVHIPYYIKGDLYRDDEPDEADRARSWFETAMSAVKAATTRVQTQVHSRYNLAEV